ncbi:MAG: glutamine synthetase family protein [Sulfolobaceae archaeon]
MSKEELLEILKTGRADYVRVEFIDILGNVRGRSLRRLEFERILEERGVVFSESLLILDYKERPIEKEYYDIIAQPDPSTFTFIPYLERTGRVYSYLLSYDGNPHPLCSRTILRNAISKLEELGLSLQVAFEPTFYLLDSKTLEPADEARAFSPEGLLEQQNLLKDIIKNMEGMGIQVEMINKHYGYAQYELTLSPTHAINASDFLIASREIIRDVARLYGKIATFMPRPFSDKPSSSMDIYIKLLDLSKGKNLMIDYNEQLGISKIALRFISGIIHHIDSLMAFASPTINSYKRQNDLFYPNIVGVGNERHFIFRVPSNFREKGLIELRVADPLANPYLLLAGIIYAGIRGINEGLEIDVNQKIKYLPTTLKDAIDSLEEDDYLKRNLGKEIIEKYIKIKKREIEDYNNEVTDWERKAYLKLGW